MLTQNDVAAVQTEMKVCEVVAPADESCDTRFEKMPETCEFKLDPLAARFAVH